MSNNTEKATVTATTVWDYVDAFELALRQYSSVQPRDFFPARESPLFDEVVAEVLRIKLEYDWSQGSQNSLDAIIEQNPELMTNLDVMALIAFEDFRQSRIHDAPVDAELYQQRYGIRVDDWIGDRNTEATLHERQLADHDSNIRHRQPSNRLFNLGETANCKAASTNVGHPGAAANLNGNGNEFPVLGQPFGKFEIVAELGRGAFGRVYVSRQTDLANRLIALKVTAMPFGESQRLAKLQHANIVPIHSLHQINGMFALCMPLFGTATLKDIIEDFTEEQTERVSNIDVGETNSKSRLPTSGEYFVSAIRLHRTRLPESVRSEIEFNADGRRSPFQNAASDLLIERYSNWSYIESVLQIGMRLAEGLHHAHSRGILHRDIKPANVLIADDGTPLLLDFNLSRDDHQQRRENTDHSVGGTLPYMPPEHIRSLLTGEDSITPQSDIYSLGVVLYQLLTGVLPHDLFFDSANDLGQAIELRQKRPRALRELNPTVSPAEESVVLKCLASDPSDRYANASELAFDLRQHLHHRPLKHAGNPSLNERWRKYVRRHPQIVSLSTLGMISLLLISAVVLFAFQFRRENLQHESLRTFDGFINSVHRAEAELFFPDGGSHSNGLQRAEEALAHYRVLEDELWQQSDQYTYLPNHQRQLVRQHVDHLISLKNAAARQNAPQIQLDKEFTDGATTDSSGFQVAMMTDPVDPLLAAADLYHRQKYVAAIKLIERSITETPGRFALWFLMGKCHYELREYRQADHCYTLAASMDQNSAMCALGRALCHYWMNSNEEALAQLAKAEEFDPGITAIYVNRALVYERQKKYSAALAELNKALSREPDTARYLMARSRVRRLAGDVSGADADLEKIKQVEPTDPESWLMKGIARLSESPQLALEDFRRASQWQTMASVARQNMAHVLSEHLQRHDEAIHVLGELLDDQPDFLPAVAGRAVLHARRGDRNKALADVKRCLTLDPTPQIHYQIACVYALLSEVRNKKEAKGVNSKRDDAMIQQALHHLSIALKPAYGSQVIAADADLKPLEESQAFRRMKRGVESVNQYAQ